MKLQKNNKYAKMIASVLLTSTILTGCSSASAAVEPKESEVIEEVINVDENIEVHDIPKDENYFYNYYKISNQERENRLNRLDIKYPDAMHRSLHVKTLIVKDNGLYKVLPIIELWDLSSKKALFYDFFTEEELFECPINDESELNFEWGSYGDCTKGYDFSKIQNAIPYFDDKEIVEYGASYYAETFIDKYLNEFSKRDGIDYSVNMDDIIEYFYDIPWSSDDLFFSTYDYADNYVTTVPLENQVTSKELGLKSTYNKEEDKYFDFWKISDEELEERLNDLELIDKDEKLIASTIQTLVFADKENNYKLMNVLMHVEGKTLELYDIYTGIHLFDAPIKDKLIYGNTKEGDHYYWGMDLENIQNSIPYFEDKTIVKLDVFDETNAFVTNSINALREKDGINYKYPESSYWFYLYPMGEYNTDNLEFTKEVYAKNYLRSVPQDMQVYAKDLKMGLDKDKVKTLN